MALQSVQGAILSIPALLRHILNTQEVDHPDKDDRFRFLRYSKLLKQAFLRIGKLVFQIQIYPGHQFRYVILKVNGYVSSFANKFHLSA